MAFKNTVSLHRVIGNFVGNSGLRNVNNIIDDCARWACEAIAHIGSEQSTKRFECEIEVKNHKACLPDNFQYLIALKSGGQILDYTPKEFVHFDKGKDNGVSVEETKIKANQLQLNTSEGRSMVLDVNVSGVFAEGDVINLTITSNDCGRLNTFTYNYTVVLGDTVPIIVENIATLINQKNLSYKATYSESYVRIAANTSDIILTISPYTDSATGTLSVTTYQPRIAPKKEEDSESNSQTSFVKTTSENLANKTTAELNTGLTRTQQVNNFATAGDYPYAAGDSKFKISNGYIYFNAIKNGKVGISYEGTILDEQGWPMIAEDHEDAVSSYLMYMLAKRDYYRGKKSRSIYFDMKTEWEWKCGQTRGNDELPDQNKMRYLANMWMQLLPLPNKTYF